MEEMIDINNCRCGASIDSDFLNLVPLLTEPEPGLHQIQCKCGRRGVVSTDIDFICLSWNEDFREITKDSPDRRIEYDGFLKPGWKEQLEEYYKLGSPAEILTALNKEFELLNLVKQRNRVIKYMLGNQDVLYIDKMDLDSLGYYINISLENDKYKVTR